MSDSSGLFRLNLKDITRGIVNAVGAAVVIGFAALAKDGFDFFSADWVAIGKMLLNVAGAAFTGYLSTALLKDKDGTIHLGIAKIKR